MNRLLVAACTLLAIACAEPRPTRTQERTQATLKNPTFSFIYPLPLKDTLEASQRALAAYTFLDSFSKLDKGFATITTEPILGEDHNPNVYDVPQPHGNYSQIRSQLLFKFSEGSSRTRQVSTKVEVVKRLEIRNDFYHGWEPRVTDGLEERVVLDLIHQEVLNHLAFRRVMNRQNDILDDKE
jgi:hypothetical protein